MDFNGDGKLDIVAGDESGQVHFFKNIGKGSQWKLAPAELVKAGGVPFIGSKKQYEIKTDAKGRRRATVKKVTPGNHRLADKYSKLDVVDLNGDGLPDIVIGHSLAQFLVYYNQGVAGSPKYGDPEILKPEKGLLSSRPSPHFVDWNGDGKLDILAGGSDGMVRFFPNMGTKKKPRFIQGQPLLAAGKPIKEGYRTAVVTVDWNQDGKLDLLAGNAYSPGKDPKTGKRRPTMGNLWLFLRK